MKFGHTALKKVGTRLLIASPLFVLGWYLVDTARGNLFLSLQVLAGMTCFVAVATIVGPSIAGLMAQPSARMYATSCDTRRPPPGEIYTVAEIRRKQGRYDEAMREYAKIANQLPQEVGPYIAMMDIAVLNFSDRERALAIFRDGIAALEQEADREQLRAMGKACLAGFKKRGAAR